MKRLVVEMEDALHTSVKMEALMQGIPAKDYIIELVKKDLAERKEANE